MILTGSSLNPETLKDNGNDDDDDDDDDDGGEDRHDLMRLNRMK